MNAQCKSLIRTLLKFIQTDHNELRKRNKKYQEATRANSNRACLLLWNNTNLFISDREQFKRAKSIYLKNYQYALEYSLTNFIFLVFDGR